MSPQRGRRAQSERGRVSSEQSEVAEKNGERGKDHAYEDRDQSQTMREKHGRIRRFVLAARMGERYDQRELFQQKIPGQRRWKKKNHIQHAPPHD